MKRGFEGQRDYTGDQKQNSFLWRNLHLEIVPNNVEFHQITAMKSRLQEMSSSTFTSPSIIPNSLSYLKEKEKTISESNISYLIILIADSCFQNCDSIINKHTYCLLELESLLTFEWVGNKIKEVHWKQSLTTQTTNRPFFHTGAHLKYIFKASSFWPNIGWRHLTPYSSGTIPVWTNIWRLWDETKHELKILRVFQFNQGSSFSYWALQNYRDKRDERQKCGEEECFLWRDTWSTEGRLC